MRRLCTAVLLGSLTCFGCPSSDETGPPCLLSGKTSEGKSFSVCYDAKDFSQEECLALDTYGTPTWGDHTYDDCDHWHQGNNGRQCSKNLWISATRYFAADRGHYWDEAELQEKCAAAREAMEAHDSSGSAADGGSGDGGGGGGRGQSTLGWGPACAANLPSGWFCVDCDAESANSFGLGTDDIQIWSHCAAACIRWDQSWGEQYSNASDQAMFKTVIEGSCNVLSGWDSNSSIDMPTDYRGKCDYCPLP